MYRTQSAVTVSTMTAETVSRNTEDKPEPFFSVSIIDNFVVYYYYYSLLKSVIIHALAYSKVEGGRKVIPVQALLYCMTMTSQLWFGNTVSPTFDIS